MPAFTASARWRIGVVRQRQQPGRLRGKGLADAECVLSGAAPIRRQAAAPSLGLDIEVVEVGENAGRKEIVAHIADGALDAALLKSNQLHLVRCGTQAFWITHEFHPLYGREFTLVDQRSAWGEERVYFYDDTGRLRRLPAAWTSLASTDAFVGLSAGRSHFRIADLLQLVALVARPQQAQPLRRRRRAS